MAEYKLILALPQSAPGQEELHYGRLCKIKNDGVYAELTEIEAKNFLRGKLINGPVVLDPVVEEEVVADAPTKEGKEGKKRGPKSKVDGAGFSSPEADELQKLANELN